MRFASSCEIALLIAIFNRSQTNFMIILSSHLPLDLLGADSWACGSCFGSQCRRSGVGILNFLARVVFEGDERVGIAYDLLLTNYYPARSPCYYLRAHSCT